MGEIDLFKHDSISSNLPMCEKVLHNETPWEVSSVLLFLMHPQDCLCQLKASQRPVDGARDSCSACFYENECGGAQASFRGVLGGQQVSRRENDVVVSPWYSNCSAAKDGGDLMLLNRRLEC